MIEARSLEIGSWVWRPSSFSGLMLGNAAYVVGVLSKKRLRVRSLDDSTWRFNNEIWTLTAETTYAVLAPVEMAGALPTGTLVRINSKTAGTVVHERINVLVVSCETYVPVVRTVQTRSPLRELVFFSEAV